MLPNGDLAITFGTIAYPLPALTEEPTAEEGLEIDKYVIVLCPGAGSVPTGGAIACFPAPLTVNSDLGTPIRGHRAGDGLPFSAVDPKSGRVFVIWSDNRFRGDVVNDIVITWSDDSGITWTSPTRVNPGFLDDLKEHFTPAIEVGKDGIVRIMYRTQKQQETTAGTAPVDTYYQQSTDSGVTFSKPLRINIVKRTDVRFAAYSRASAFLGDYNQVAVGKSWAYIVRCEAYSTKKGEPATFPPTVHHQRTWVSVVDADGDGRP